jgi:hypothetical protein
MVDVMDMCHTARALAIKEFGNPMRLKKEWSGALPKRKGPTKKVIKRILKEHDYDIRKGDLTGPEQKMLLSAYDQGLLEKHSEEQAEDYMKLKPLVVEPKSKWRDLCPAQYQ